MPGVSASEMALGFCQWQQGVSGLGSGGNSLPFSSRMAPDRSGRGGFLPVIEAGIGGGMPPQPATAVHGEHANLLMVTCSGAPLDLSIEYGNGQAGGAAYIAQDPRTRERNLPFDINLPPLQEDDGVAEYLTAGPGPAMAAAQGQAGYTAGLDLNVPGEGTEHRPILLEDGDDSSDYSRSYASLLTYGPSSELDPSGSHGQSRCTSTGECSPDLIMSRVGELKRMQQEAAKAGAGAGAGARARVRAGAQRHLPRSLAKRNKPEKRRSRGENAGPTNSRLFLLGGGQAANAQGQVPGETAVPLHHHGAATPAALHQHELGQIMAAAAVAAAKAAAQKAELASVNYTLPGGSLDLSRGLPLLEGRYCFVKAMGDGGSSTVFLALDTWHQQQGGPATVVIKAMHRQHSSPGRHEIDTLRHMARWDPSARCHVLGLLGSFVFLGHTCLVLEHLEDNLLTWINQHPLPLPHAPLDHCGSASALTTANAAIPPIASASGSAGSSAFGGASSSAVASLVTFAPQEARRRVGVVRELSFQLLLGLAATHSAGLIHADLKPENILISHAASYRLHPDLLAGHGSASRSRKRSSGGGGGVAGVACLGSECGEWVLKLADFGNAFEERHARDLYTHFDVQTLCYRAPEVLLGLPFGAAVDMWSLGCVIAELALGGLLFSCRSPGELLKLMVDCLGRHPPRELFKRGELYRKRYEEAGFASLAAGGGLPDSVGPHEPSMGGTATFVDWCAIGQSAVFQDLRALDAGMADLVCRMLQYDPRARISAHQALVHPFFGPLFAAPEGHQSAASLSQGATTAAPAVLQQLQQQLQHHQSMQSMMAAYEAAGQQGHPLFSWATAGGAPGPSGALGQGSAAEPAANTAYAHAGPTTLCMPPGAGNFSAALADCSLPGLRIPGSAAGEDSIDRGGSSRPRKGASRKRGSKGASSAYPAAPCGGCTTPPEAPMPWAEEGQQMPACQSPPRLKRRRAAVPPVSNAGELNHYHHHQQQQQQQQQVLSGRGESGLANVAAAAWQPAAATGTAAAAAAQAHAELVSYFCELRQPLAGGVPPLQGAGKVGTCEPLFSSARPQQRVQQEAAANHQLWSSASAVAAAGCEYGGHAAQQGWFAAAAAALTAGGQGQPATPGGEAFTLGSSALPRVPLPLFPGALHSPPVLESHTIGTAGGFSHEVPAVPEDRSQVPQQPFSIGLGLGGPPLQPAGSSLLANPGAASWQLLGLPMTTVFPAVGNACAPPAGLRMAPPPSANPWGLSPGAMWQYSTANLQSAPLQALLAGAEVAATWQGACHQANAAQLLQAQLSLQAQLLLFPGGGYQPPLAPLAAADLARAPAQQCMLALPLPLVPGCSAPPTPGKVAEPLCSWR